MTTIYVKGGQEIPGDSWVAWTNASGQDVTTQPINMTPAQMTRASVTTVQEAPKPDEFYGPVVKDPNNPGQWIQTPYTAAEMKPRLEDYSSGRRLFYETGGVIFHSVISSADIAASTTRDDRSVLESAYTFLQVAAPGTTATIKLMRVQTVTPPVYGSVLFVKADLARVTETKSATNKWSDLCFTQEHTLFDQIEAGTITTKEPIDAAYLTMQQGAFPVVP